MNADRVLVDTWGWLALADDREPRHADVRTLVREVWQQGQAAVTTDYVLDETFTLVFRRLAFAKAQRFVTTVEAAERQGSLHLERVDPERFARAKALRKRLRDKPLISFTDITTMVVMQELHIRAIVTADAHFRHVGLGFEMLP